MQKYTETAQKCLNVDSITKEDVKAHNPNCPQIPDLPYRILITEGSGYGKTKALLNLISQKPQTDKIYLYTKDPYEVKYKFLINKCKGASLKK